MPRLTFLALLFIGPIIATSFLAVWQRNEMIRIGYETEVFTQKKKILLRDQKELLVQVERLSTLDRIEKIAIEKLGMKQPESEERIYIKRRTRNAKSEHDPESAGEMGSQQVATQHMIENLTGNRDATTTDRPF